jgi:WhiB family transcriptional regulator, redox-sensing transcriptional regulator
MTADLGETLPALEDLLHPPAWYQAAACRGVGADTFVFDHTGTYETARAYCAVCPVRTECLETALADPRTHGLWGGTSPNERKAIRLARNRASGAPAVGVVVRVRVHRGRVTQDPVGSEAAGV